MSLPPALLRRLAQRGLVQSENERNGGEEPLENSNTEENEEVIAEDYDEMETDGREAEEYDYDRTVSTIKKRTDESSWADRMRARMGTTSYAGYKGCPNKYNIWHKCTLFCVTHYEDGKPEPNAEYMQRYKRLLKKFPLPKGWTEMYDPGCGCYYFYSASENLVCWLPPTHPKSQVSRSAAALRRQLEESGEAKSDGEQSEDEENYDLDSEDARGQADTIKRRSQDVLMPRDMRRNSEEQSTNNSSQRKQRSRDLDRLLSRQQRNRERERERERERDKDRERERASSRRQDRDDEKESVDPMDPSSYSDAPRGKWSDGLEKAQRSN